MLNWAGSPPSSPSPSPLPSPLPLLSFASPPGSGEGGGREEAASQFGNWHPGSLKLIPFSLIPDLEITVPIRHSQHLPGKVEYGVYESGPRKSIFPPRTELRRGDWKTDSTSSTASKQVAPRCLHSWPQAPSQLDSSRCLWVLETCPMMSPEDLNWSLVWA